MRTSTKALALTHFFPLLALNFRCSHGSDSVEAAQAEIALWFNKNEINEWTPAQNVWLYE